MLDEAMIQAMTRVAGKTRARPLDPAMVNVKVVGPDGSGSSTSIPLAVLARPPLGMPPPLDPAFLAAEGRRLAALAEAAEDFERRHPPIPPAEPVAPAPPPAGRVTITITIEPARLDPC